jgi:hypothetical protein
VADQKHEFSLHVTIAGVDTFSAQGSEATVLGLYREWREDMAKEHAETKAFMAERLGAAGQLLAGAGIAPQRRQPTPFAPRIVKPDPDPAN